MLIVVTSVIAVVAMDVNNCNIVKRSTSYVLVVWTLFQTICPFALEVLASKQLSPPLLSTHRFVQYIRYGSSRCSTCKDRLWEQKTRTLTAHVPGSLSCLYELTHATQARVLLHRTRRHGAARGRRAGCSCMGTRAAPNPPVWWGGFPRAAGLLAKGRP
jgi:hypothetical protein